MLKEKLQDFLTANEKSRYDELKAEQTQQKEELGKLPPRDAVLGLAKTDPKPPVTYVLRRGSPQNEGPAVTPSFPKLIGGGEPELPTRPDDAKSAGRRRVLADWLASEGQLADLARYRQSPLATLLWSWHCAFAQQLWLDG